MAKDLYDPDFEQIDRTIDELERAYKILAKREDDEIDRAVETIEQVIDEKKRNQEVAKEAAVQRIRINYKDEDAETEAAIYTLQRLSREREKAEAEAAANADKKE